MQRRLTRALLALALIAGVAASMPAAVAASTCNGLLVTIEGTVGDDLNLVGTAGDDVIKGFGGDDVIFGMGGNDVICGDGGSDIIDGGAGSDAIFGGRGADNIQGGTGDDTVRGGDGHDIIDGGAGSDAIFGGRGADDIQGGTGDDTVRGGDGHDIIDGGADKDRLYGNDGMDTLLGGSQPDRLFGGNGADTAKGMHGSDILDGGAQPDTLLGGGGNDTLRGQTGNDELDGGPGSDRGLAGPGWDSCVSTSREDGCEGPTFLETFDGDPSSPQSFTNSEAFSVSVNSRIGQTQHELAAMDGDHTSQCDPPPGTHVVQQYEDALYRCHNHMMTAVSSGLFLERTNMAVAMFSPNQIIDFSGGPATIRFDVSTMRASRRDWFDIWVTPFDDLQRIPIQAGRVLMQGPSENALVVALRSFSSKGVFDASIFANFQETVIDGSNTGYESVITPSRTVRSTFEIIIERDHLKVWMPDEGLVFIDEATPDLPFDRGIVQFGHNSYEVFECDDGCDPGPATWHWDNIELTPAVPMTAIPASQRFVNSDTSSFVSFATPAPESTWVHFTAIGKDLEVSFDGGASWHEATTQHTMEDFVWRYRNYAMPVPAGTTTMHVRGTDTAEHVWQYQDISFIVRNDAD